MLSRTVRNSSLSTHQLGLVVTATIGGRQIHPSGLIRTKAVNTDPCQRTLLGYIVRVAQASDLRRPNGWLPMASRAIVEINPVCTATACAGSGWPRHSRINWDARASTPANCGSAEGRSTDCGGCKFPGTFADYEAREHAFRVRTGKDAAILKETAIRSYARYRCPNFAGVTNSPQALRPMTSGP